MSPVTRPVSPPEPPWASGTASGVGLGGRATMASLPGTCIRSGLPRQHGLPLPGPTYRNIWVPTCRLMCWGYAQEMQIVNRSPNQMQSGKKEHKGQNHGM